MAGTNLSPVATSAGQFGMARPFSFDAQTGSFGSDPTAFAPLVFREWSSLEGVAEKQVVPARQELFSQDTSPNVVFFIESGLVKLVRLTDEGGESILGLRSDGWIIDAASTVLNCPHACSAVTLTPCRLRRVPRPAFMELLNKSASLTRDLNRLICCEIHADQEQQFELRNGTSQGRLDRFLRELSRLTHDPDPLERLPLKKLEIAQLLSITPEHLSRLLRLRDNSHTRH